jgi:hypothetical protein
MQGAPSHVDTFDYKPKLIADAGKQAPSIAGRYGQAKLMRSAVEIQPAWQKRPVDLRAAGQMSPSMRTDLCVLNSMATDLPAHPQAFTQLHTGTTQFVRPSLGSWTLYGLGTMNQNLPGFVTINPPGNATRTFGSAFLPAIYQGTKVGGAGIPGLPALARRFGGGNEQATVANIKNNRLTTEAQRTQLDLVQALNQSNMQQSGGVSAEVEGVIESYELAFRMQAEVPKVLDLSKETEATKASTASATTRRTPLASSASWRASSSRQACASSSSRMATGTSISISKPRSQRNCNQVDKPIAGLLADLKARGLLKGHARHLGR